MKKPQYARGFIDRHGKARFYFRRKGRKQIPLPGLPWSLFGRSAITTVVHLGKLCRMVLSSTAIADSELEIDGKRRVRPSHAELKSRGTTGQ